MNFFMWRNGMHSMFVRYVLLAAWCWLASGVKAAELEEAAVRAALESMAKTNTYFSLTSVVKNRELSLAVFPRNEELQKMLVDIKSMSASLRALRENRSALAALLEHDNPKVRTLALGALFMREDKADLPLIASLLDDSAPTFLHLHENYSSGFEPLADLISPLKVEEVAQAMLKAAEMPSRSMMEFKAQWQKYEGRPQSAKWFQFKLERANRRTSPIQGEYRADIQRVIAEMEALPLPDRGWTRLFVLCTFKDGMVTDDYLVAAARELGPDALLRFMQGEKVTEDPDVRLTGQDDYRLGSIRSFILLHADQLLRPEQFETLLSNGRSERVAPFWLAGAALVRPDRASEILRGAITAKMPGSALLASVLWRLRGQAEAGFLADWFYSRKRNQGATSYYVSFLGEVRALARKETPELMKALIRHEGFHLTNWGELDEMLVIAGDRRGAPLIERRKIYDAWQREDGDLKGALAEWRNLLRREYGFKEEALPPSFLKPAQIVIKPKWSQSLPGNAGGLAISPDAKSLAVLTNGMVTIWEAQKGTLEWQIPGLRTEGVMMLGFPSQDNRLTLLDRAKYGRFIHWNLTTRKAENEVSLSRGASLGLERNYSSFSFDAETSKLGVAYFQSVICVDTTTGKILWRQKQEDGGKFAVLSSDGKLLASQCERGVNLWDATNGKLIRKLEDYAGDVEACAFSRDAKLLATVSHADGVRVINLKSGKTIQEYAYRIPHWGHASLLFSPDGRRLAVVGTEGGRGYKRVGIFRTDKAKLEVEIQPLEQQDGSALKPMVFAPDGKILYTLMARLEAWSLPP